MKSRTSARAFTLVELLIVVGIIALLVGILLPVVNKARRQAQELQCMSNLRQWGVAYQMYCDANRGWLPDDGQDGSSPATAIGAWDGTPIPGTPTVGMPPLWFDVLPPYVGGKPYSVLQDAAAVVGGIRLPHSGDNNLFVCPTATDAMLAVGEVTTAASNGYYNIWGYEPITGAVAQRPTYFCYVPNSKIDHTQKVDKMSQLRPGSTVILMLEKRMMAKEIPSGNGPDHMSFYSKTLSRVKSDWQRFAGRHRSGGHILFADGHVAWFLNYEVANFPGANNNQEYNQPGKLIWNPFGQAN